MATVSGGSGPDSISGTDMDDVLFGYGGNDSLDGARGDDTLDGGTGADLLDGGSGDDWIFGGAGNDTLYGGDEAERLADRVALKWNNIRTGKKNDKLIQDGDEIANGTQTVKGVEVKYSVSNSMGRFEYDTQCVEGMDRGDGPASDNSALSLRNTGTVNLAFSEPIENAEFRVNNFDYFNEHLVIRAYDAAGNLIPYSATLGSNVGGVDNDSIPGADTFEGLGGEYNDDHVEGSLLIQIPGPVARIELDYTSIDGWRLSVTDIYFDDPDSVVDAEAGGNDHLDGGDGDDLIYGGEGNDTLIGDTGDDTLIGGAGDDHSFGGDGNDVIAGGQGDDLLTGGAGNDTFVYNPGDGHDTISDFTTDDPDNNDTIDLSGFYDHIRELRADFADDGLLNQSNAFDIKGNPTDYSDNQQFGAGSLTLSGIDKGDLTVTNTGVVCFTSGTAIRTPKGEVLIDDLRPGDLVSTMDNGAQPIVWVGRRQVGRAEMLRNDRLHPVLIRRGVLGAARDLLVSRQHGVLIGQDRLARAVHLAKSTPGIRIAAGRRRVTYIHLMLESHQILFAESMPSESFYPGPMALKMLDPAARRDLTVLFPALKAVTAPHDAISAYGAAAREWQKNERTALAPLDAPKFPPPKQPDVRASGRASGSIHI